VRNFIYKILVLGHQKAQAEPIHVWNIDKDFMVHELTPVLHRRSTGGNLQMNLTYATIPIPNGSMFRLNRELERNYHVEDPRNPRIMILCIEK
jgi:hypothetical protein